MNYAKPPKTISEQAELLKSRGLQGDKALIEDRLWSVNYYRLSGYWHNFKEPGQETFRPGTTIETVWNRYVFDRRLRLLVMDALERIEVSVRTQLAYHHAHKHDPFAYATDTASLPGLDSVKRQKFCVRLEEERDRSKERFVAHFLQKYGNSHDYLPVWMATEIMTFGSVLTFFRGSSNQVKKAVASVYGVHHSVFRSWLLALNTIRNVCAHHGRLWNRELGTKPVVPKVAKYPEWHQPVEIPNNRVFVILTICRYGLKLIAPQSGWHRRLKALLDEFPDVPKDQMGFPPNWEDSPIWR